MSIMLENKNKRKKTKVIISLAKFNPHGGLYEIEVCGLKQASRGDFVVYSNLDRCFHYMFKQRGRKIFMHRTNQKTGAHLDLKTIFLRNLIKKYVGKLFNQPRFKEHLKCFPP